MTFEDPSRRAAIARLTLALAALASFVLIGADIFQIAFLASQGVNPDDFTFDDVVRILSIALYLAVVVATVIAFCRWEHRAARNARALQPRLAYSPRWVIAWWFIPVLNLVVPYRTVGEVWRASGRDDSSGPAYIGAWWGCLVGGALLGNLAGRISSSASTVAGAQLADVVDIVSNVVLVIAAALAMRLVADLTRRQLDSASQRLATSSSSESTSLGPGRLK